MSASRMHLRAAKLGDANLLLEWRNEADTRPASQTTHIVSLEEQKKWLAQVIADQHRDLYIAEIDGQAIGTVRADKLEHGWELSWNISSTSRDHSFGKTMLTLILSRLRGTIHARIRDNNFSSNKLTASVGMTLDHEQGGMLNCQLISK